MKKKKDWAFYTLYDLASTVTDCGAPTLPAYIATLLCEPASTVLKIPVGTWKYTTALSPGFNEIGPDACVKQSTGLAPEVVEDSFMPNCVGVAGQFVPVRSLLTCGDRKSTRLN